MTRVLCILFLADAAVDRKKKDAAILLLYSYFHQVVHRNSLVLFLKKDPESAFFLPFAAVHFVSAKSQSNFFGQ